MAESEAWSTSSAVIKAFAVVGLETRRETIEDDIRLLGFKVGIEDREQKRENDLDGMEQMEVFRVMEEAAYKGVAAMAFV